MKTKILKYYKHKKNIYWYLVVAAIFAFGYFYAFRQTDVSQIITLSVLLIALTVYLIVEPKELDFIATEDCVEIDGNSYAFANMRGFTTFVDDDALSVHFYHNSRWRPTIKINLTNKKDAHKLLVFLEERLEFLEEEKEPLIDYYLRLLRF